MFKKIKRWWRDNATLLFAQGLIGTLREFFRIREVFAPPEKQAKFRRVREEMERIEREKVELLREVGTVFSGPRNSDQVEGILDKVDAFGKKYGNDRDDSEWQIQREKMRASRRESDALVAINASAGEDNTQAIAAFESYIRHNPESHNAYTWLAGRLTKIGDYDAALAAYRTAIHIRPADHTRYVTVVTAKNAIAEVQFLQGDTDAAILSFQEAIAAVPENSASLKAISYFGLGNLYEKIGDIPRAKTAWKQAVSEDTTGVMKAEAQKKLRSR